MVLDAMFQIILPILLEHGESLKCFLFALEQILYFNQSFVYFINQLSLKYNFNSWFVLDFVICSCLPRWEFLSILA
ncbi:hypothetical protein C5167_042633 [Papaver somniferum]|uniref:Uncharacterized protein n=1 Tax=Papaver somniferum TaxID=3469 RepID=A0A4Y7L703_PAPSO|nr:hypothetical protein C5167_042633 [Papaver somniferum]